MGLKLQYGTYPLLRTGLPRTTTEKEELLQNATLRLTIPQGNFLYDRTIGSRLSTLDTTAEHAADQALSLANEALMGLPGVQADSVVSLSEEQAGFTVSTPLGSGTVWVYF